MDREQALNTFWNSFGVKAYEVNTVPDNAPYKKIAYEVVVGDFGSPVPCTVYLYDRHISWQGITELLHLIDNRLKHGGVQVPFDNGTIWICKASPFATRLDGEDDTIRRIVVNLQIEYLEV